MNHPWKLTPADLTKRLEHCTPENQRLLTWAFHHCAGLGMVLADFCLASDVNYSTMGKLLNGTYIEPRGDGAPYDLPTGCARNIAAYKAAIVAKLPSSIHIISTDTSRKVAFNCDLARESRSPVFLTGASHIGKTTALNKYRDTRPHDTFLVTVTSGMGAKGLAVAVCEEIGVSSSGSLAMISRRLRKAVTRDMLIIFDDFHVLTLASTPRTFLSAMEFIRALYDSDQCGMLFSTTDIDFERITKEFKTALHQLLRRGIHRPHLGSTPLQKDVRAILEAHGLKWPHKSILIDGQRPFELISRLAQQTGLKGITERLRYALKIAAREASPVTWSNYLNAEKIVASNSSAPKNDWD
ncbi:MAG: ATP-binding protein [bacterium]